MPYRTLPLEINVWDDFIKNCRCSVLQNHFFFFFGGARQENYTGPPCRTGVVFFEFTTSAQHPVS